MLRAAPLLLLTACIDYGGLTIATRTDTFEQAPTDKIDVLFVVDDSSSMADEQELLAVGFTSFVTSLDDAGTDFHLGVVTTSLGDADGGVLIGEHEGDTGITGDDPAIITRDDDYVSLFADRVVVGIDGDDQEMGLEAAATALSEPYRDTVNAGFLRDEAKLLIVFVTDEDDCSHGEVGEDGFTAGDCYTEPDLLVPTHDYVYELGWLKDDPSDVALAGIIGPRSLGDCGDSVASGSRYRQVITHLDGQEASICQSDFSDMLFDMGLRASGVTDTFYLAEQARTDGIEVSVDYPDGTEGNYESVSEGWQYNSAINAIVFTEEAVPPRESTVEVSYRIRSGT